MKAVPGWVLGVLIATMIGVAGWLGYVFAEADPRETGLDDVSDAPVSVVAAPTPDPRPATPDGAQPAPAADVGGREADRTLRVQGLTLDSADPELPAACIRLSSATDPARVIEDKAFIRVVPDVPFSLDVRGRQLCVLGLDADQAYQIRVLPGLASVNGREVADAATLDVAFDPKPAMVGFVGDGIILPRVNDAVLGLKAMNAGDARLTVYRVNHRALFQSEPDIGETAVEGQWSYNYDAYRTRVEIHTDTVDMSGDTNALVERGYPLSDVIADHGAGAYIVEFTRIADESVRRPAKSWRWLYVTDIALASYRSADALHVTARSIDTAKTLPKTRIAVIARNNDLLAEAVTDADGRAIIPGAAVGGTGNLAPKLLLAYRGEADFAALDLTRSPLDLSGFDVAGRDAAGAVEAYLYTDRGVYRPGETVRLGALIRDRAGRAAFDRDGTLVVTKPDGSEMLEVRVSPSDMAGALYRDVAIPPGAPRGRYTARLTLDGMDTVVGTLRWAVEDFVPEQLRVSLRAPDGPVIPGEPRTLTVAADFLYGAAGRDLQAEVEARIQPDPNPFPDFAGYQFGNAVEPFRETFVPIAPGATNEEGRYAAVLELGRDDLDTTLPLRARVSGGVAEPSGRFIRDSLLLPVRPRSVYVGFKPDFDNGYARRGTPAQIDIIALSRTGERVAREATLRLYVEDYDYQWFREDGRWRYRRDRRDRLESTQRITIPADAPFRFARTLDYGQYRLEVEQADGVSSVQFGSGWRRASAGSDAPDRFELGLDAASYTPGDTLALTLDAPFAGEAELVVADGGVQRIVSLSINEGAQTLRLKTGRESVGDLYVMATLYSPLGEGAPRRAVGLVHVPRDRDPQTLNLSLAAPDTVRPRGPQTVKLALADAPRGEVWMTLAAVDTGILQITDFDPPEPETFFFGKQAFALDVHDDYARMLAPFNGADRVGGDVLGGAGLSVVPTQTVALWHGPARFDGRRAEVTFDIPDFQGELTLMAVVWSEARIGSASTTMVVRDPVTAQLALPRFLAPGDMALATLALDNVEGRDGDYVSSVQSRGDTLVEHRTALARGERGEETVPLTAGPLGVQTLRLRAKGPGFAVERDYSIQTRSAALPRTVSVMRRLAPAGQATLDIDALAEPFLPSSRDLSVSATFSPLLDPAPLLSSLGHYPYGCTEQTVSVAAPLLLSEAVGSVPGLSDTVRRRRLQAAVDTLLSRQDADGAFGLWRQGDRNASPYLQLYASEFLLDAEAAGYSVPATARRRTLDAVRALASLDGPSRLALDYNFGLKRQSPDYERRRAERAAYAHALLARHDSTSRTQLSYLHDRFAARMVDSVALSQLGAALAATGDAKRAAIAFGRAAATIDTTVEGNYYASPVRNAAALMALAPDLASDDMQAAFDTLPTEASRQLNTHEEAWLLRAVAQGGNAEDGAPFAGEPGWSRNGRAARRTVERDQATLSLTNPHDRPVWVTLTVRGQPAELDAATSRGIGLTKTVMDMSGTPIEGRIDRGERAVILLEAIPRSGDAAMWVLADLLPAGFEIETVLQPTDAGEAGPFAFLGTLSEVDLTEARDDRFIASWRTELRERSGRERTRRVAYVVRAVTEGDFVFPGAHVEDMYRAERSATTEGGRLVVSRGGTL